jgi:AcrR family transcriptional regulator
MSNPGPLDRSATELASHPVPKRARGRPRKTADERDDGNRRPALLAAAARLFREQGFDATSTRDVAAAVGMHSGSPFYHFKSKDALLYAVMQEGMRSAIARQKLAAAATEEELGGKHPLAQFRRLIRSHFETLLGPGNDFVPVMLYERRALSPSQRTSLANLQADYESVWTPVLEALYVSGHLRAPVTLSRLLILGALNWSVQWFDHSKSASLDDLTDAAIALFLKAP